MDVDCSGATYPMAQLVHEREDGPDQVFSAHTRHSLPPEEKNPASPACSSAQTTHQHSLSYSMNQSDSGQARGCYALGYWQALHSLYSANRSDATTVLVNETQTSRVQDTQHTWCAQRGAVLRHASSSTGVTFRTSSVGKLASFALRALVFLAVTDVAVRACLQKHKVHYDFGRSSVAVRRPSGWAAAAGPVLEAADV